MVETGDFCPGTLYGGGCDDPSCGYEHDVRICDLCVVVCSPASNYKSHVEGRQHLAKLQASLAPTRPVNQSARRCTVCSRIVSESAWASHLASEDHKKQQHLAILRASYEHSEVNKRDVTISHADTGVDLGVVSLEQATEGVRVDVTVSTQSPEGSISIVRTEVRSRIPNHSSLFAVSTTSPSLVLVPYQPLQYTIFFRHALHGRYEARLEFTFQAPGQAAFVIARRLLVVVSNAAERDLLKPIKPFERGRRAEWNHEAEVLVGQAPKLGDKTNWARDLPQYHIPPPLLDILRGRSPEDVFAQLQDEYFPVPLSQPNHAQYFQYLLWIEENRMADDLRMYDMVGVEFGQKGRLNTLYVHGLAEKRPSVTINDTILAQAVDGGPTHKGVVHEISQDRVCVHFHGTFEAGPGRRFNVRFQLNRTSLRREHQALFAPTSSSQRLLFPVPGFEGLERPLRATENAIALFNSAIGGNFPQLQAVKSILSLRAGMAPFIVYGPPGTGKTVTIVEAIIQILRQQPTARIMACAPSNSAADILAQRLRASLTPDEMFRCNAIFRDPSSVPSEIIDYTFRKGHLFGHPPLSSLAKFKVIVTTCINASFAYNLGLTVGHFTHVFVDEAGQASEPEVLIPIKPLSLDSTRIILSGDPKQLGPVVRSSVAREFGLEKSYLERLMERPVYSDERGRGTSYVKLTKNYRSHEGIIQFSNEKFYDGELEVCGNPDTINAYLNSPQLATPRFPVVFHAISGRNDREASSPSYFNIDEAIQVKAYVNALLKDHRFPLQQAEIGVITPYHAQVRKIRRLLRENGFTEVKVGSVEEFQGQERRVVIVSTVRSSGDLLAYDAKFALGFLSNARRFNVAMTRAQALLLVIGDSAILSVDPLWRAFMNYVYLHNGWRGDEPTWDVNAPVLSDADYADELREAMAAEMNSVIAQQPAEEDIEAEANVDRNVWLNEDNTDW